MAIAASAQNQVQVDLDAGGAVYPFFSNSSGTATNDLTLRIGTFNSATDAEVQALGYNLLWVGNQFTVMTPGTGTVVTKSINSQAGSYSSDGSTDAAWTTSNASALNEQIWLVYSDSSTLSSSTVFGVASGTNAAWDMPASYSPGTTLKELYSSQIDTVAFGSTNGSGSTGTIRTAAAPATYLYWDSNGAAGLGGAGTWSSSTSDLEWTTNASGVSTATAPYAWGTTSGTDYYAGAGLTANFTGTAGTVTVSGTVQSHKGMEFSTNGYTLSSGTINLAGSTASDNTITVTTGTTTISSVLTGSNGMTKAGSGVLRISGVNTYTGNTIINAGTLDLRADNVIENTSAVTISGGTLAVGAQTEAIHSMSITSGLITIGSSGNLTINNNPSSITGGEVRLTAQTSRFNTSGSLTLGSATMNYTSGSANSNANAFVLGGNIIVSSSATFDFLDSGGAAGNPEINLNNNTRTFDVGSGANLNVNWQIGSSTAGSGALIKEGAGTMTLNATNAYTGLTTINNGTLVLGNATNTIADSGAVTISGGTLSLGANNDSVGAVTMASGSISGTGKLTGSSYALQGGSIGANLGTGTITIATGTTTLSGTADSTTLNINSGNLTLGAADRLADGATLTVAGGILNSGANTDTVSALNMSSGSILGSGTLTATTYALSGGTMGGALGAGTANITNTVSLTGTMASTTINILNTGNLSLGSADRISNTTDVAVSSGGVLTLNNNNESLGAISGAGNITLGSATLTTNFAGSNIFSGAISGSGGSLTKSGAGTLVLSGGNTYTGKTAINSGTISINADTRLGTAPGSVVADQLTLDGGTLAITAGFTMNTNRGITLGASGGAIDVSSSQTLTYGGVIAGSGNPLSKTGAGSLSLSGVNTYTGTTTISAGTLRLNGAGSSNTVAGDVLVNGGTLNYQATNNEQIADTSNLSVSSGAVDFVARSESLNSLSISGGAVNISSGTISLGSSGSFTGGTTTISGTAGRISITGPTTFGNGTIDYSHASNNNNRALVLGGNVNVNASAAANLTNSSGGTARLDLNDASRTFTVGDSSNINIAWVVTSNNTASGALVKAGNGTLTLSNTNLYTGGTTINAGTLTLGHASDTLANSAAVTVSGGVLNLGSSNDTVGQVTITSGTIAGTGTLTGSAYALQGGTVNANLGAGTITASSGTTTLGGSAASTTVNISSGALALGSAGTLANTATISVSSGATLDLTAKASGYSLGNGGTLNGLGTVTTAGGQSLSIGTGATIAPATSSTSGTLTVGGLAFASGGTYAFTMGNATGTAGTNWDLLSVANNFDISATPGSTFTIAIGGNSGTPADFSNSGTYSWDILTLGSGSISGFSADKFTLTNNLVGITGSFSISSTTNALTLSYAPGASAVLWSSSGGSAWLTAANWTGNAVPTGIDIAQFGTNPTSATTGVGINMGGSTNNGSNNQIVGAIEVTSARTNNLVIGNSGSVAGALTLNGAQSGGVSNVVLKNSGSGNLTIQNTQGSGSSTMAVALAQNENVVVIDGTGGITVSSAITGSGKSLALQGSGSGVFTLAGNNTYTGNTTITSRTLAVSSTGRLGGGSYSGNISNSGTFVFGSDSDQTLSGIISGSGSLTKNGTGRLTLSGDNTNTGAITVNTGALRASNNSALGTAAGGVAVASGAALELIGGIAIGAEALSLTGSGASGTGALRNISGANSHAGATTLAGATTIGSDAGTLTLTGGLSGTNTNLAISGSGNTTVSTNGLSIGSGTLTKNGSGTLTLSASNTYTGATTINSGTLDAAHAGALGSTPSVTVNTGGSLLVSADGAIDSKNLALASTAAGNATAAALVFSGSYNGTAGSLTLSANSTIDLGTGSVVIRFSDIVGLATHTLSIYNWTGTTLWGGTDRNNTDQLYVTADITSHLGQISFYSGIDSSSFLGTGYQLSGSGFYNHQVIPVPEPETMAAAIALLAGTVLMVFRRKRAAHGDRRFGGPPRSR